MPESNFEKLNNQEKSSEGGTKKLDEQVDEEEKQELLEGLQLLQKIKQSKGEELSDFQKQQLVELEKMPPEEKSKDFNEAEMALGLLENVKRMKKGEPPLSIDLGKLSEKEKKEFEEAIEAQKKLFQLKQEKAKENEPIRCPKCGNENKASANFCVMCGTKLEKGESVFKCPKCGNENKSGDNFCRMCGNKLEKEPVVSESEQKERVEEGQLSKEAELKQPEQPAEKSEQPIDERIKQIQTREELYTLLDSIKGIQGAWDFFESGQLKTIINEVLNSKSPQLLDRVPRTLGLRDKINEIMVREKISGI